MDRERKILRETSTSAFPERLRKLLATQDEPTDPSKWLDDYLNENLEALSDFTYELGGAYAKVHRLNKLPLQNRDIEDAAAREWLGADVDKLLLDLGDKFEKRKAALEEMVRFIKENALKTNLTQAESEREGRPHTSPNSSRDSHEVTLKSRLAEIMLVLQERIRASGNPDFKFDGAIHKIIELQGTAETLGVGYRAILLPDMPPDTKTGRIVLECDAVNNPCYVFDYKKIRAKIGSDIPDEAFIASLAAYSNQELDDLIADGAGEKIWHMSKRWRSEIVEKLVSSLRVHILRFEAGELTLITDGPHKGLQKVNSQNQWNGTHWGRERVVLSYVGEKLHRQFANIIFSTWLKSRIFTIADMPDGNGVRGRPSYCVQEVLRMMTKEILIPAMSGPWRLFATVLPKNASDPDILYPDAVEQHDTEERHYGNAATVRRQLAARDGIKIGDKRLTSLLRQISHVTLKEAGGSDKGYCYEDALLLAREWNAIPSVGENGIYKDDNAKEWAALETIQGMLRAPSRLPKHIRDGHLEIKKIRDRSHGVADGYKIAEVTKYLQDTGKVDENGRWIRKRNRKQ